MYSLTGAVRYGYAAITAHFTFVQLYAFCMISPFPFQNEVRFIERFLAWRRSDKLFRDYLLEYQFEKSRAGIFNTSYWKIIEKAMYSQHQKRPKCTFQGKICLVSKHTTLLSGR